MRGSCLRARGRLARLLILALLLFGVTAGTALATIGTLNQLPDPDGCVSDTGSGGDCVDGTALSNPVSVTVSPDATSVYAASFNSAVAVLKRNTTTGALSQSSGTDACVSEAGGECTQGRALKGAASVAVSPDKKSVYVAANLDNAVAVFKRSAKTGKLTQLSGAGGCVSDPDGGAPGCTDAHWVRGANSVTVSPDKKSVYVTSTTDSSVTVFKRNTRSGKLTPLPGTGGCVSGNNTGGECADGKGLQNPVSVAVSPDGKSVYVASPQSSAVAVFQRNTTTGALTQVSDKDGCVSQSDSDCTTGTALTGADSVAVSPDNKSVYVTSPGSNAVDVFSRDTTTGKLSQPSSPHGCVSQSGGDCATGTALSGANSVAVSRDNVSVYVASRDSNAVAVLSRDATTGELSQSSGTDACVSDGGSGGCATGKALLAPASVAVSPETQPKSVYSASNHSDAVDLFARSGS